MTPAEHYALAEMSLDAADDLDENNPASLRAYEALLRRAQVHATLATAPGGPRAS